MLERSFVHPQMELELHPEDAVYSFFLEQEAMHREETRMTTIQRRGLKNLDPMGHWMKGSVNPMFKRFNSQFFFIAASFI